MLIQEFVDKFHHCKEEKAYFPHMKLWEPRITEVKEYNDSPLE